MESLIHIRKAYDALPKIAKILLQLFFGYIIGGVYRIIRYFETHNVATLVVGIVVLFSGVGNFIIWLVDLYTVITEDKIKVLAD